MLAIDDLHYAYNNGNQLKKVSDATTYSVGYNDRHTSANVDDFEYDTFGNLIMNRDKDIQTVVYNHLNLPVKVTFGHGASLAYTYTANGTKIEKTATDSQSVTINTEYVDSFQYTQGVLDFFPHAEGYVKATATRLGGNSNYSFNYVFNFTDHLGNIRLKYTEHPQTGETTIIEDDHYYPYGLKHIGYNNYHQVIREFEMGNVTLMTVTPLLGDSYKYKFGGKEYQDEFDINMYDFGARNYDPALGRWMNIDPLAEMMRRHSPYNYAFNNPNYFIDPDGMAPGGFANINPVTSTGAMEVSDFGGGNESGKLKSSGTSENSGVYKGLFQQAQKDIAKMDVSLDGGSGCPDGDCGGNDQSDNASNNEEDQTGNAGTGISATAKGIEVNSKNNSNNYRAKYGARDGNNKIINREQITKRTREIMSKTAIGARIGGVVTTGTFGAIDIYKGFKQDGNQWGYYTTLALGKTVGGGVGGYYVGNLGVRLGTIFGGGPGAGTVAGGGVGAGAGGYFGSIFGEFIVNTLYGVE